MHKKLIFFWIIGAVGEIVKTHIIKIGKLNHKRKWNITLTTLIFRIK